MEWAKNGYKVSTDKSLLDIDIIADYLLKRSYWAQNRSIERIEKSIENSLCYGVYSENRQVGFARVVTDYSVFYYLCDLFILEDYRGKGLGKFLTKCVVETPELKNARGMLNTKDAQGLYRQYGFLELDDPNNCMVKRP